MGKKRMSSSLLPGNQSVGDCLLAQMGSCRDAEAEAEAEAEADSSEHYASL